MISLEQAFRDIRVAYKKYLVVWLTVAAIMAGISFPNYFFDPEEIISSVVVLLSFILTLLITPGITSMALLTVRKKTPTLSEVTDKAYLALKMLGIFIVYGLMVMLGLVAFIIPGIYLAIRYWPAQYILIDNPQIGVFDSLTRAGKVTKGKMLALFGAFAVFGVAFGVLVIAPDILLDLAFDWPLYVQGLVSSLLSIIFLPVTTVGAASVYNQLSATAKPKTK